MLGGNSTGMHVVLTKVGHTRLGFSRDCEDWDWRTFQNINGTRFGV
jgi:hypothetical protein